MFYVPFSIAMIAQSEKTKQKNIKWRGVRFERSLWEPEVLKVHDFFTELLSMEGKYAVKLSITELIKISWKLRKRYNGRLWKMQMWSASSIRRYQVL